MKGNNSAINGKKAGKDIIQGRFFSLDFFKRNAVYIIALVVMTLAYIANKFVCQSSMQEVLNLKVELANAQTDLVNASADYNSMILESEMTKLMREKHLGLTAPDDPPYELKSK
ncbi:MAG: FtsL-like putative cell division protein [Bacteroidales bacterium]|jgi:hypothetical protein|nr:FtsL-like putative cell division protein [Bacteroidales bacterium]